MESFWNRWTDVVIAKIDRRDNKNKEITAIKNHRCDCQAGNKSDKPTSIQYSWNWASSSTDSSDLYRVHVSWRLKPTRWETEWRKRRTEQSPRHPSVRLWRATAPWDIRSRSGLNLSRNIQSESATSFSHTGKQWRKKYSNSKQNERRKTYQSTLWGRNFCDKTHYL